MQDYFFAQVQTKVPGLKKRDPTIDYKDMYGRLVQAELDLEEYNFTREEKKMVVEKRPFFDELRYQVRKRRNQYEHTNKKLYMLYDILYYFVI